MSGNRLNKSNENYIAELEEKVEALENEVRNMQSKLVLLQSKKHSKKELREMYGWNEQDVMFSDTVMTFCKEFLFPRYKFLGRNWTEKIDTSPTSFSELVRRNLPLPRGLQWGDAWHRIITPTIAKKYTDMRCNINNDCRNAFLGKFVFLHRINTQYLSNHGKHWWYSMIHCRRY